MADDGNRCYISRRPGTGERQQFHFIELAAGEQGIRIPTMVTAIY